MKWLKLLLLTALLLLIGLAIWLHADQRTLNFAKPWILDAINPPDAPYSITIGDVSIDWRNAVELGEVRISNVTFAKRDGNVFAQLPAVFVTIDPIGFLPTRHMLHTVTLHEPRLFLTRTQEGAVELGLEGASSRMALNGLFAAQTGGPKNTISLPELPFHDFIIDRAQLTFTDVKSGANIVSSAMALHVERHGRYFDASLQMPFMLDDKPVDMRAEFVAKRQDQGHTLSLKVEQFPAQFICLFAACPDKVSATGLLDGMVMQKVQADKTPGPLSLMLGTRSAVLTAPPWFAEPLKFGQSTVNAQVDWNGPTIDLVSAKLALEDTSITASAKVRKAEDGWYATADGEASQLDVKKIYKYWPLFMAPDSRAWITAKLKSGYAAKGTLKLNLTPTDFSSPVVSDGAVDAMADAREITFEYLPGFPLVEKMNGIAHFTGTTVKVEGGGGSMLGGTKITKAILWCPELNSPNNPMEATVEATAPAADAVALLSSKYFTFDDGIGLDAKTISGTVEAAMKLKFNAFSSNPSSDPNEIHLDAVDYDISTKLINVAQNKLAGSYNASAINGELKASNAGMGFNGSLALADTGISDVKLVQDGAQPMTVQVKSREGQKGAARNDFSLKYKSATSGSQVSITGKRLDASVAYGSGGGESTLLKNFPAIKLDIALDELLLAAGAPFTQVTGKLDCSAARCESADFKANAGSSLVRGGIARNAGERRFTLNASDAGSFLKALDISDRMTKGKLAMNGTYDDKKSPPELKSRLTISEFTLKNSQILGRILTIGSLTGLQNALTGSGISFDKLTADITSRAGLITVAKGVANGTAIGITVAGTVDTTTTKLGLKGVVVPAYALNSILGKIPLIGMIVGGEGEGLIAFNYWVNGTYDKPDVGVNPLSGLTPGFLRGIFSIFDETPPVKAEDATPKKSTDDSGFKPMHRR
ncbi:MAG: AsmA-like C-terminal domain-containing protein [Pseudomonadota bacterium]